MTVVMLAVAAVLVAFDFQNLLAWWHGKLVQPGERPSFAYTIIVPLYGHPRYFAGRDGLVQYRANVLVALEVTPPPMQVFADELEAEGWKVHRLTMEKPSPADIMDVALDHVTTPYALRLDADTRIGPGLEYVVAGVKASDADLCSVKVEAENTNTIAAKLQALEYRIAMLSRHYRPWLTSGACFIGKTESLRLIFANHSLWTPGEDIETGRVAHALRMTIRHADFVVRTEVPDTWAALFKQRRLWWAGSFRHAFVNADRNLIQLPVFSLYTLLAVFASAYFRWWTMIDWHAALVELPLVLLVYAFVTFISNLQVRSWWMLIFPLYALAQSLVMPVLGAFTYFVLAHRKRSAGRFRVRYRRGLPPATLEQMRYERIAGYAARVEASRLEA
jgi:Glycosyl transferase family group 2